MRDDPEEQMLSALERYARLRDQGAISPEEFEAAKARILAGRTPAPAADPLTMGPATVSQGRPAGFGGPTLWFSLAGGIAAVVIIGVIVALRGAGPSEATNTAMAVNVTAPPDTPIVSPITSTGTQVTAPVAPSRARVTAAADEVRNVMAERGVTGVVAAVERCYADLRDAARWSQLDYCVALDQVAYRADQAAVASESRAVTEYFGPELVQTRQRAAVARMLTAPADIDSRVAALRTLADAIGPPRMALQDLPDTAPEQCRQYVAAVRTCVGVLAETNADSAAQLRASVQASIAEWRGMTDPEALEAACSENLATWTNQAPSSGC